MTPNTPHLWTLVLLEQRKKILDHYGEPPASSYGPIIRLDWDGLWYPRPPTPTILWEGGPHEWAIEWSLSPQGRDTWYGWYSEPENGFILSYFLL